MQISQWKRAVQEEVPRLLSSHRGRRAKEEEALKATLYQQIGQLQVEVDWLKKKSWTCRLRRSVSSWSGSIRR